MATNNAEQAITLTAAADYSAAGQYRFVSVDGNGEALVLAAQGGDAIGVLANNPGAHQAGRVVYGGVTKVIADAIITPDDKITPGATGGADVAAQGDHVVAHAITGGAVGDVIEVLMAPAAHPILA